MEKKPGAILAIGLGPKGPKPPMPMGPDNGDAGDSDDMMMHSAMTDFIAAVHAKDASAALDAWKDLDSLDDKSDESADEGDSDAS